MRSYFLMGAVAVSGTMIGTFAICAVGFQAKMGYSESSIYTLAIITAGAMISMPLIVIIPSILAIPDALEKINQSLQGKEDK